MTRSKKQKSKKASKSTPTQVESEQTQTVQHKCIVCGKSFQQRKPSLIHQIKPNDPDRDSKEVIDEFSIHFGLEEGLGISNEDVGVLFDELLESYGGPGYWEASFCPKHEVTVNQLKEVHDTILELETIKEQLVEDMKRQVTKNLKKTDKNVEINDPSKVFHEIRFALRKAFMPSPLRKRKKQMKPDVLIKQKLPVNATSSINTPEMIEVDMDEPLPRSSNDTGMKSESFIPDHTSGVGYGNENSEIPDIRLYLTPKNLIDPTFASYLDTISTSNNRTFTFSNSGLSEIIHQPKKRRLPAKKAPVRPQPKKKPLSASKAASKPQSPKKLVTAAARKVPLKHQPIRSTAVAHHVINTQSKPNTRTGHQSLFTCRRGCGKPFWSVVDQERHYANNECGKQQPNNSSLIRKPSTLQMPSAKYKCEICGEGFRLKTHFNSHSKTHHANSNTIRTRKSNTVSPGFSRDPFECFSCGEEFESRSVLNKHTKHFCSNFAYL